VRITLLRHATLIVDLAGCRLLVDPLLDEDRRPAADRQKTVSL
jgi:L-ascorbate metabolism protein UlaG (beta-lactamase superfamily)